MADHEHEIRVLEGLVRDAGLEERVREVSELVKRDENEEGDVEM
jgi:hypothetical protein